MTKKDKRLKKLRQNPKDVSFEELKQILEDFGFVHVRTSGSHHTFIAVIGENNWRLTVPFHRPIKTPYIQQAIDAIEEIIKTNNPQNDEQPILEDEENVNDND